jgi:uncharacterized protein YjbI with pentapeptide repeats
MPENFANQTLRGCLKPGVDLREADFNNANLRGVDFRGRDLSGAIFNNAQIQGANFSHANLQSANFTRAKAGLQKHSIGLLLLAIICLSAVSGLVSAYVGYTIGPHFQSGEGHRIVVATASLLVVLIFFVVSIRTSTGITLWIGFVVLALINGPVSLVTGVSVTAAGALISSIIGTFVIVSTVFVFESKSYYVQFIISAIINIFIAVCTSFFVSRLYLKIFPELDSFSVSIGACGLTSITMLLSACIAWKTLAGDEKFTFICQAALTFTSQKGTNFEKANLTGANFTEAMLKCTSFNNSTVSKTYWSKSSKLNRTQTKGTILIDADVRELLVTGIGQNRSYVGRNLKGANLQYADLSCADLTEADISGATLVGANLKNSNLTKTQALGTIFNQATLTGACLEAWNIDSTTHLEGAICEHVYLFNNHRERRPSNGTFASEEFAKLFQKVLNTVDLIFQDGIDWKAFVTAFEKLKVQNLDTTELTIQSIENKGDGVVVVRVHAPPDVNKEKIHGEFNQNYEVALKALEAKYQAELQAKENEIALHREKYSDLKEISKLMAQQPININTTSESKSMNDSTDSSRKIEIGNIGGDFNASGSALNLGDISGTVTNTLQQLQTANHPNAPQLADLLQQLQLAINDEPELPPEGKAEALTEVNVLAEAGKNPQKETQQKKANTALEILKSTIAALTPTASLVKACSELLPAIAKLLGL